MILVIDNYDSFTRNLIHYLREIGADVRVERNDALSAAEAVAQAMAIVISPGPLDSVPADLVVNATAADGTVQGFRHRALPIHGVPFHPESIASEHGHALLRNFVALAKSVVR